MRIDTLSEALGRALVEAGMATALDAVPSVPAVEVDGDGLLAVCDIDTGGDYGGRLERVWPAGTPTTKVCPATGHVVCVARPDRREGFMDYAARVSRQITGGDEHKARVLRASRGELLQAQTPLFTRIGGYTADGSTWHLAVDAWANPLAYLTPEEKAAADRAAGQWADVFGRLGSGR